MDYDFAAIEEKWQKYWLENKTNAAEGERVLVRKPLQEKI